MEAIVITNPLQAVAPVSGNYGSPENASFAHTAPARSTFPEIIDHVEISPDAIALSNREQTKEYNSANPEHSTPIAAQPALDSAARDMKNIQQQTGVENAKHPGHPQPPIKPAENISGESNPQKNVSGSDSNGDESNPNSNTAKRPDGKPLSDNDRHKVAKLQMRDGEVKAHEQAHLAAAGNLASGGASYEYEKGPDGKQYAVGGEVQISSGGGSSPEEKLQIANRVVRAALAPANPSAQDRAVATEAMGNASEARAELAKQSAAKVSGEKTAPNDDKTSQTEITTEKPPQLEPPRKSKNGIDGAVAATSSKNDSLIDTIAQNGKNPPANSFTQAANSIQSDNANSHTPVNPKSIASLDTGRLSSFKTAALAYQSHRSDYTASVTPNRINLRQ